MSNAWNFGINLWTMSFQTTSAICLHIIMSLTISKLEIETDFTYIKPAPMEHVMFQDTIYRNYWIDFPSIWLTKWRRIVCNLLLTILNFTWLIYIIMTAMKSTAIFATKTDRDNRRSKDSGILAGLWSLPAVQYSWCEFWLGVFAMVMFPHRL